MQRLALQIMSQANCAASMLWGLLASDHCSAKQFLTCVFLVLQMQHLPGDPDIEIGYRLLIPVVHVGALIGRGGEAIAQLRQRTRARVKVHEPHDSKHSVHACCTRAWTYALLQQ